METLEIHAKSYLVKWVNAPDNSIIDWQVQPLKKSINFAIYRKKIDSDQAIELNSGSLLNLQPPNQSNAIGLRRSDSVTSVNEITRTPPTIKRNSRSRSRSNSILTTNLNNADLILEKNYDKLLPNELVKGKFRVEIGGAFAFLLDNSFSKTTAKKVYFDSKVLNVVPTENVSESKNTDANNITVEGNDLPNSPNAFNNLTHLKAELDDALASTPSTNIYRPQNGDMLQSILLKKRRKRHQGFTKRFFTLDLKNSVLSYHIIKSNKVRGSMPIKHSIISANKAKLEIIIDSGMEVWDLKALNEDDFNIWVNAFNLIKSEAYKSGKRESLEKLNLISTLTGHNGTNALDNIVERDEYEEVDFMEELTQLNFQINNIKAQIVDMESNELHEELAPPHSFYSNQQNSNSSESFKSISSPTRHITQVPPIPTNSPTTVASTAVTPLQIQTQFPGSSSSNSSTNATETLPKPSLERRSTIWKRSFSNISLNKKSSQSDMSPTSPLIQQTSSFGSTLNETAINVKSNPNKIKKILNGITDLSNNMNQLIKKYESHLIYQKQQQQQQQQSQQQQHQSKDMISLSGANSILSSERQEFYDAEDYLDVTSSGVMIFEKPNKSSSISNIDSLMRTESNGHDEDEDDEMVSSNDDDDSIEESVALPIPTSKKFVSDLYPLPISSHIQRRKDIPICTHSPPSILVFVRKNVGKDLSTIAMPVTMNEPLTILQKFSEMIEYCSIIDNALESDDTKGEKILRIASFAVSYLSSMRAKERNCRKPFNPLLGETFELVREDLGVRLISEKVCHRPQIFATFIESENWEISFAPSPDQKFWGKNAEIVTTGTLTLTIKKTGEVYQWLQPRTLLKNVIAGEKYTEPSSNITITSSYGQKAVVEFKIGGMFSGRSEELTIKAFDKNGKLLPNFVKGKWTESLTLSANSTEKIIWSVGKLLPNYQKKFGFTEFAASLNVITELERGKISPTDSRLRPDVKKYENGLADEAESLKLKLEEDQRVRRKTLEEKKQLYKPQFFVKNESKDIDEGLNWMFIEGDKSYWNRRKVGDWDDLTKLW